MKWANTEGLITGSTATALHREEQQHAPRPRLCRVSSSSISSTTMAASFSFAITHHCSKISLYTYNADGLRVSSIVTKDGDTTFTLLYEGGQFVLEFDESGAQTEFTVFGGENIQNIQSGAKIHDPINRVETCICGCKRLSLSQR